MRRGNTSKRKIKALAVNSVAVLVTGGLFLTMSGLVANDETMIPDWIEPPRFIDVVQGPDNVEPPIKETIVEKPPVVTDPPPTGPVEIPREPCVEPCWDVFTPTTPHEPDPVDPVGYAQADGEMMIIAAFPPQYPQNKANNGIEGYVVISLTVTADGQVEAPFVVEAEPEGAFNRAALKAIRKFKYKPRVVDGIALPVSNVLYKMTFELED